jgi:hypothetical protein
MSDDKNASGGTDESSAQNQSQNTDQSSAQDQVSYDTYKKTVAEVKKLKAELKAREEALTSAQQEKLAAEGNKDELINQLKGQVGKLEKAHKETFQSFVRTSVDAQVKEIAQQMGCIDPDAVIVLAKDNLKDLEVDAQTFKADQSQVTSALEELKKGRPYLFSKPGPRVNSSLPNAGSKDGGQKSFKNMSRDELWQQYKEISLKEKK